MPVVISAKSLAVAFDGWCHLTGGANGHSSSRASENESSRYTTQSADELRPVAGAPALCLRETAAGTSRGAAPLDTAAQSVVAVATAGSWASGVLLSSDGFVLTVAHAVEERTAESAAQVPDTLSSDESADGSQSPQLRVRVRDPVKGLSWLPAAVVYRFSGALDLAVLKISDGALALEAAKIALGKACVGQPVFVVSFPPVHESLSG